MFAGEFHFTRHFTGFSLATSILTIEFQVNGPFSCQDALTRGKQRVLVAFGPKCNSTVLGWGLVVGWTMLTPNARGGS